MKVSIVSGIVSPDQPTRIAERAELQGEAEPVRGPPTAPDQGYVVIAEDIEPEMRRLVFRQVEQRCSLAVGEDRAVCHLGLGR
jgi:hypothetical protein